MTDLRRRNDIDWLRVFAMLIIFLFHCARFFNDEDWHVKNNVTDYGMSVFVAVLNQWIMPLFFMLSALGTWHALRRRTAGHFLRERVKRLMVPLFFGMLFIVSPQVYIERVSHGQFAGSFFDFMTRYFDGFYAFGGNFPWMGLHLWYLEVLFIFSLITLPLILMELIVGLDPGGVGRRDFGGWSLFTYLVFFILGYLTSSDERYRAGFAKYRLVSLAGALIATTAGYFILSSGFRSPIPLVFLRAFNSWFWLSAILGFGGRYLKTSNGFLAYANIAVLPFYILHQTVIVMVGYFIRDWSLAVMPKYLLLAIVSFALIMVLYEYVVRRFAVSRLLFGMKTELGNTT